jgi:hypothetical protein
MNNYTSVEKYQMLACDASNFSPAMWSACRFPVTLPGQVRIMSGYLKTANNFFVRSEFTC